MNQIEYDRGTKPIAVGPLRMTKPILGVSVALLFVIVWALGSFFPRANEDSSIVEKLLSNQSITFALALLLGLWVTHVINSNPGSGLNPNYKMYFVAFLAGHFGSQVFPLIF